MTIIEIATLSNGAHRNQTGEFNTIPTGWALIPNEMVTDNFPFGEIEVEEKNGIIIVTKWTSSEIPLSQENTLSSQLRQQEYNTEKLIEWDNNKITVTQAAQLWQYYAAEGSLKANMLQELIAKAKQEIRLKYPD